MAEEPANVAEELQQEEIVQPQEQNAQESQSPEVEAKEEKAHFSKDENFARLRETKEQLERENRELKEWAKGQLNPKQPQADPEEDLGIDDDDLVEGKQYKKLYKKLDALEKRYEQEKAATIPDRLQTKFKDFDQVVTQENVEKLKNSEPELYASITSGHDLYAKGVSAYKTLKALGIAKVDEFKDQKAQVQQNHSKPMSAQAIKGQGALSDANIFAKGLTPELKKQLQSEMQDAAKAR